VLSTCACESPSSVFWFSLFLCCAAHHRDLHSFPTRRSSDLGGEGHLELVPQHGHRVDATLLDRGRGHLVELDLQAAFRCEAVERSEEHTSELQSRENLVCRLLLEKKKRTRIGRHAPEDKGGR